MADFSENTRGCHDDGRAQILRQDSEIFSYQLKSELGRKYI